MFLNILDAYFNRVEHKLLSILLLKMPGAAMKTDRARNPSPLYAFPQRLKCSYCIQLQSTAMGAYKVTIHKKKRLMGVEYFLWLSPTDLPVDFKFYIVLSLCLGLHFCELQVLISLEPINRLPWLCDYAEHICFYFCGMINEQFRLYFWALNIKCGFKKKRQIADTISFVLWILC